MRRIKAGRERGGSRDEEVHPHRSARNKGRRRQPQPGSRPATRGGEPFCACAFSLVCLCGGEDYSWASVICAESVLGPRSPASFLVNADAGPEFKRNRRADWRIKPRHKLISRVFDTRKRVRQFPADFSFGSGPPQLLDLVDASNSTRLRVTRNGSRD
jgi:hypothetical protein